MKRVFVVLVTIVILALAGLYFYLSGKEYEIRVPESEIKARLSEKLPMTKSYLFVFQVTLKNPRVSLEQGSNRVNGGLDIVLNIKIGNEENLLGGTVDISGGVRYAKDEGQVFLVDPIIENLKVQGVPDKYSKQTIDVLTIALGEYFTDHPIYTLSTFDAKQAAAKFALKNVAVGNKELVITLGI